MSARELLETYGDELNPRAMPPFQLRDAAAPKAFAALRRVLSLHPRDDDDNCAVCWDADGNWASPYPCETVLAIEEALKP